MARAQASGHDRLVCDDDPVSESVHSVLKLGVTLQVGLHLPHFVQQLVSHLQRKGGVKNEKGEGRTDRREATRTGDLVVKSLDKLLIPCSS